MEVERKFLINDLSCLSGLKSSDIIQGYLSTQGNLEIRVRIKDNIGFITVKSNENTIEREEIEIEIPLDKANELLKMCNDRVLSKTRFYYPNGKHIIEIDVFKGNLSGLVLAEIELDDKDEYFKKPDFIWKEVTGDPKYYSKNLFEWLK